MTAPGSETSRYFAARVQNGRRREAVHQCGAGLTGRSWECAACGFAPVQGDAVEFTACEADSYNAELFSLLERVEPSHFWFLSRNELIASFLSRYCPDARSLLEVGCGTGFVLEGITQRQPELQLVGVELFEEGLRVARRRLPEVELLRADAHALPFESEFDVVCAFDVLEHIEDDVAVLREMSRSARRGGVVMLTVPQHRFLWSAADDVAAHQRRYTRHELVEKVRGSGIDVIRATSFVTLLFPMMLATRWLHRSGASYDFADEFKLPSVANRLFLRVMAFERRLIDVGLSLPFGGSLLLVGRVVGS